MAVSLDDMVSRLQNQSPPRNGVPEDYEQIFRDAVLQVSLDAPLLRTASISIQSGVGVYALPNDFLSLVDMPVVAPLIAPGTIYPSAGWTSINMDSGGLIPIPQGYQEVFDVAGTQITFNPVPTYSVIRSFRYAATYALVGDVYPTLSQLGATAAMVYAKFLVSLEQAGAKVHSGWSYSIGNERIDKSKLGATIAEQASRLQSRYESLISRMGSNYGSRSSYDINDLAWL